MPMGMAAAGCVVVEARDFGEIRQAFVHLFEVCRGHEHPISFDQNEVGALDVLAGGFAGEDFFAQGNRRRATRAVFFHIMRIKRSDKLLLFEGIEIAGDGVDGGGDGGGFGGGWWFGRGLWGRRGSRA